MRWHDNAEMMILKVVNVCAWQGFCVPRINPGHGRGEKARDFVARNEGRIVTVAIGVIRAGSNRPPGGRAKSR